jgi:inorganic pyrophosphatase/exopolyphosphatase
MKVNAFIVKTRQLFNELAKHRIVIGNQAADLDSIVSAISMSFFLTSTSQTTDSYLPVINSNRKVLQSKKVTQ